MDDLVTDLSDAPLAQREPDYEDEEEWSEFSSQTVSTGGVSAESTFGSSGYSSLAGTFDNLRSVTGKSTKMEQAFQEGMSRGGSLEDLVGTFEEKISQCFGDMDTDTDFAPVQIRTHDELMCQSKFWQDLTASFGTVMPVDWSKTVIRNKLFLPVLALHSSASDGEGTGSGAAATASCSSAASGTGAKNYMDTGHSSSDEELNGQLDMHNIVVSFADVTAAAAHSNGQLASVDDVIKEIDAIMQQGDGSDALSMEHGEGEKHATDSTDSTLPVLPSPLYEEKLQDLNGSELLELQAELERLTQKYSEILIQELALRDELLFEKEVKTSFIDEWTKVQRKREQFAMDKKRQLAGGGGLKAKTPDGCRYLTTIIPYESGQVSTRNLQIIIKILAAISEDSPTTPALLTDYILKVLCPKEENSVLL